PTGTRPLVPSASCQSTRSRKAFSSTDPFLNGVTSAVNEPRNLVLAGMSRSNRHDPSGVMCINIGSSTRLKGFFVWIDEVREQHGLAAVAQIKQTQLAGRSKF